MNKWEWVIKETQLPKAEKYSFSVYNLVKGSPLLVSIPRINQQCCDGFFFKEWQKTSGKSDWKTALVVKVYLCQSLSPLSPYLPTISLSFFVALDYLLSHILTDQCTRPIHSPAFYFDCYLVPCFPSHCCACAYYGVSLKSLFSMTYDSWLIFILETLVFGLFV